ncbi:MAG TPA: tetratricopeptide repeat protein [Candidatus Hydrogenedentes bacterium]|nr:tetratricopeptide repeat protein [Candidatus Hydrogenedentota bacterium]
MNRLRYATGWCLSLSLVLYATSAWGIPEKGSVVPSFTAYDIRGQEVDLDKIMMDAPDMVVLFFFNTDTGEDFALRLRYIDRLYGRDKLKIVAFGFKEDEEALKRFADDLRIEYYILPDEQVDADALYGPIKSLPLSFVLTNEKVVIKVIRGGGESAAAILSDVAETYLMQGKGDKAQKVADAAVEFGEPEKPAKEIKGYAMTVDGDLEGAEAAFASIDSKEGLATVALEKGELDKAIALADEAGPDSGYADTVKGKALMRSGELDEAATVLESAAAKPAADWQKSEAATGLGRLKQERGDVAGAIGTYDEAVGLNPWNVDAMSNQADAYRSTGNLDKAVATLERAQRVRDDDLVVMMLRQLREEQKRANDIAEKELIRKQINDLRDRYRELKEQGLAEPVDPWTTRPLVLAFLPAENKGPVFFERAGTELVLRREIESRLRGTGYVRVVDREVLDTLLQELSLGTSEVADPDTQLALGKVLSAQMLGFVDFAQAGDDILMYLRMVNSETTGIDIQLRETLKGKGLGDFIEELSKTLLRSILEKRELRGLIADASDEEAILINLSEAHGLQVGQRFLVLEEGEPIEVGGKIIQRDIRLGAIEVTEVEADWAVCKVVRLSEGVKLAKGMRIKELGKQ